MHKVRSCLRNNPPNASASARAGPRSRPPSGHRPADHLRRRRHPTIPAIAQRAGVNHTSIYRRWGSREALLADVVTTRLERDSPLNDTGSLRGNLTARVRAGVDSIRTPEGRLLIRAAALSMPGNANTQTERDQHVRPRLQSIENIRERAHGPRRGPPPLDQTLGLAWPGDRGRSPIRLGDLPIDRCGTVLGDARALDSFVGLDGESVDGLTDVTSWGKYADDAHAPVRRPGVPTGDETSRCAKHTRSPTGSAAGDPHRPDGLRGRAQPLPPARPGRRGPPAGRPPRSDGPRPAGRRAPVTQTTLLRNHADQRVPEDR